MDTYLRCEIKAGLFSDEVAVCGKDSHGTEFSLFAPEASVETEERPGTEPVEGWLRVEVLQKRDSLLLVQLPAQAFENGVTLTVLQSQVAERRRRERA